MMESLKKALMFIAAIGSMLILISLATNLLNPFQPRKERISGSKEYVVATVLKYAYDCFKANEGRKESVICYEISFRSNEEISSKDILDNVYKIPKERIVADDLGYEGEIIIRYEFGKIYVEKVEDERISS